jgi:hypothetical protein
VITIWGHQNLLLEVQTLLKDDLLNTLESVGVNPQILDLWLSIGDVLKSELEFWLKKVGLK